MRDLERHQDTARVFDAVLIAEERQQLSELLVHVLEYELLDFVFDFTAALRHDFDETRADEAFLRQDLVEQRLDRRPR